MTNGEKMQEIFPEGKTRKCIGGVVFESSGWCHAYGSDWWNAEYKEPTTKNDLGVDCISRAQTQTEIEMNASRYTIAKERGGMGQVEWSDQLIKVSDAVDIIRHLPSVTPQLSSELEKNSQKLEKDFGELDCISRADAIRVASGYCHPSNVAKELAKLPSMGRYDPYTDKFIKE